MKVSVIIPIYNTEQYLNKCIDSVLNQTMRDFELLLIDDGSKDSSGMICDTYAQQDSRVRVVHKENAGQGVARNLAMDMAAGEYYAFLDSDDYWDADYLEKMLWLTETQNAEIAVCEYRNVDHNYRPVGNKKEDGSVEVMSGVEAAKQALYWKKFGVAPWAKLWKAELWKGVRFKEDRIYEDLATTYQVYVKAARVAFVHKAYMTYYLRLNSDARMAFNNRKMMTLVTAEEILKFAREECPALLPAAHSRAVASAFFLYLQMPQDPALYREEKKQCVDMIRKHRKYVVFDRHTRKKTWGGAVLSYLGMGTVRRIFMRLKKGNPVF